MSEEVWKGFISRRLVEALEDCEACLSRCVSRQARFEVEVEKGNQRLRSLVNNDETKHQRQHPSRRILFKPVINVIE